MRVPAGADLHGISEILAHEGVIETRWLFRLLVWAHSQSRSLQAGEYRFAAATSMRQVLEQLASGAVARYFFTVPEGFLVFQVSSRLREESRLRGLVPRVAEGSLLPETYTFVAGSSRASMIDRMQKAMQEELSSLERAQAFPFPLENRREALILASIVEKESREVQEQALIAGVFLNRLRRGMRLQSDPTVVYALTQGKRNLGRLLRRSDLKTESPYNTYRHAGLPPGPIGNPGKQALRAVFHPIQSDYLYFVADGKGGHLFARTLREHIRNDRLRKQGRRTKPR